MREEVVIKTGMKRGNKEERKGQSWIFICMYLGFFFLTFCLKITELFRHHHNGV